MLSSAIEHGTDHHIHTDHMPTRNRYMFVPYCTAMQFLQQILPQAVDQQGKPSSTVIEEKAKSQNPYPCCAKTQIIEKMWVGLIIRKCHTVRWASDADQRAWAARLEQWLWTGNTGSYKRLATGCCPSVHYGPSSFFSLLLVPSLQNRLSWHKDFFPLIPVIFVFLCDTAGRSLKL